MHVNTLLLFSLAIVAVVFAGGHDDDSGKGHDDAHYKFEYGVHDPHTHDKKDQYEERHGKHLHGGYEFKEADGTHRIVKYKAGPHTGFEAIVERKGHAKHAPVYGKHHIKGEGGTSYVGVVHWGNQGAEEHGHDGGHGH